MALSDTAASCEAMSALDLRVLSEWESDLELVEGSLVLATVESGWESGSDLDWDCGSKLESV